jgi:hypothetical protein
VDRRLLEEVADVLQRVGPHARAEKGDPPADAPLNRSEDLRGGAGRGARDFRAVVDRSLNGASLVERVCRVARVEDVADGQLGMGERDAISKN